MTSQSEESSANGIDVQQAVHHFIATGDDQMIRAAVLQGVDANTTMLDGSIMLHWACDFRVGSVDLIKFLLQHGADVDSKTSVNGTTALFTAAHGCRVDFMEVLVAAGANVNVKCIRNITPLHAVTDSTNRSFTAKLAAWSFLVDAGADPNAPSDMVGRKPGQTPLEQAGEELAEKIRGWECARQAGKAIADAESLHRTIRPIT